MQFTPHKAAEAERQGHQSAERGVPLIDQMIEFAMEELLSGSDQRRRALVRGMAERWPDSPALSLAYALTSAAAAIEESFGDSARLDPVVPMGYRLAALVASDVHAIQSMGQVPGVAEDLLHFWRRVDPAFLRI